MTNPAGAAALICPKCQATMRSYERSGITVDQCTQCRGIFLDRGELERLMDAEAAYATGGGADAYPPASGQPVPEGDWSEGHRGGYRGKRRRGFLGELFD